MPTFRRTTKSAEQFAPEDVIWGVPRRETASDQDDPLLHAGVTQHAFLIGVDYQAICGFKPALRTGFVAGTKSPQLALPGRDNPRCPKCSALITSVGTLEKEAEAERAQVLATTDDQLENDTDDARDPSVDDDDEVDEAVVAAYAEVSDEEVELDPETPQTSANGDGQMGARDAAWAPRRSSARRGGRATIPTGKRSVVVQLPDKLIGSVIAADIEGERGELRVRSVAANDDGTIRITLNQTAPTSTDVLWFVVSGSQRS